MTDEPTCTSVPAPLLSVAGLALAEAAAGEERRRPTIRWPSREFRDLQSAIDAAPDDAIIQINQGVYQIDGPISVRGKRLVIKGAGSGRKRGRADKPFTLLAGPPPRAVVDDRGNLVLRAEEVQELWNLVGSDVVIRGMRLTGFDAAIVSKPDDAGHSGPTRVSDVVISDTGCCILSLSSADLSVEECTIMKTKWNAISFGPKFVDLGILAKLATKAMTLINPGGAGIYCEHSLAVIDGVVVLGADAGGIVGVASSSFITNSDLVGNREAGILLSGGFSQIFDNTILGTTAKDKLLGDGISLWASVTNQQLMQAVVIGNLIQSTERAGFSVFGATADLEDNLIICATFDLFGTDYAGFTFELNDLGQNQCGCGELGLCAAKGDGTKLPPMVGGLE